MSDELRKRIVSQGMEPPLGGQPEWFDLAGLAEVEVTSEVPEHPIDHALVPRHEVGWRADGPGPQRVRILFDEPQTVRRIYLHFLEDQVERTQEFVLRWAETRDGQAEEIVRQRWNFAPSGSTHEIEDYRPSPRTVAYVELEIVPDVSGGDARASLEQLRLG